MVDVVVGFGDEQMVVGGFEVAFIFLSKASTTSEGVVAFWAQSCGLA